MRLSLRPVMAICATAVTVALSTSPAFAAASLNAVRVDVQPSGNALVSISFGGAAPPYKLLGANTSETSLIFDNAQIGPQTAPSVAGAGAVSSVSISQNGTSTSVALHLTAATLVHVRQNGNVVFVDVPTPQGQQQPGLAPPPPSSAPAAAAGSVTEVVDLKYADVSEIAGVLVSGSNVASNDNFAPTQSNVGASSLGGGSSSFGGFQQPQTTPQQNFGGFGGQQGGGLSQRLNDNIAIDRRLNAIILTGTPDVLAPLKDMIEKLDVQVPSVILETEIVELSDTAAKEVGLDLSPSGSGVIANANVTPYTIKNLQPGSGEIQLGAVLYAQIQAGNGRVLAKPRIFAQSGQQASILTGDAIPISTSVAVQNAGVSQSISYVNVGVNLQIQPRVSSDGYVTSHIYSDVSSVSGFTNGAPQISQRTASTIATVHDGDAFVIGGLLQDNETRSLSKLPFIGDLPIIGQLFTHVSTTKTETNLYIIITPHIIPIGGGSPRPPSDLRSLRRPAPLPQSTPPPGPSLPRHR